MKYSLVIFLSQCNTLPFPAAESNWAPCWPPHLRHTFFRNLRCAATPEPRCMHTKQTPRTDAGFLMTDDVERTELHHRQLDLRFFQRSDGLFEVEGRLLDRKTHPFRRLLHDRDTPAGAPLHD